MDGDDLLVSLLKGYSHQYQLDGLEYDDQSGEYCLKFWVDSGDVNAVLKEVKEAIKENSGQQFVHATSQYFAFSSQFHLPNRL